MVFSKLLKLFAKGKAQRALIASYEDMYLLSSDLVKDIEELSMIKKELLSHPWLYEGKDAKGIISLKKGVFMEEVLLPKLKHLEKEAINRSKRAKESSQEYRISGPEIVESERTLLLLEDIRKNVPTAKVINNLKKLGGGEKIKALGNISRSVTELAKEFHLEEGKTELIRKVLAKEVSPLIRRVFDAANESNSFKAYVLPKELRAIAKEAKGINAANDSNWKIAWRDWWRKKPKVEVDKTTPLKEKHANITIVLNGEKKDIHLVLR